MLSPHSTCDRLEALDTCVISDALDTLGLEGVLESICRQTGGGKVVGRAVTVELAPLKSCSLPARYHLGARALDDARPGCVIVVANAGRKNSAAWGGLLSRAARVRGVSGVVVDGLLRDKDEIESLGLSVFALGSTPVTARGRVAESAYDRVVDIGNIGVSPGDWIVADGSGVVVVPDRHASEIVEAAEGLAAIESGFSELIELGRDVSGVLAGRYEEMVSRGDDE